MQIIAHRGASGNAPENTLPAIQLAVPDAHAIEIDVQLTKDNRVVVFHDERLERTTNGSGWLVNHTWKQIKQLDAGSWFDADFSNTHVPSLKKVLHELSKQHIDVHIELKNNLIAYTGIEKRVIRLIQELNMESRVIISSFRRESLERCQQLAPNIRCGYLCWGTLQPFIEGTDWGNLQLYSIHPHIHLLNNDIFELKRLGYKIFPYVINHAWQIDLCQHYRVDGVFTNYPAYVRRLLEH